MKITSLQENLKSGLFLVSHIAGKNINLPILNNVMIEARGSNIRFITTDLEIGIVATVRGKVDEEGVFTVDAKIINEYISLLPNKKVEFRQKDLKLNIKSENYKTTIKGQAAEDFPLIPHLDKKNYYKAGAEELKQALAQVIFSVSTTETRVELSGVLFDLTEDKLTLVATDSYRLAERTISINTNGSAAKRIIVPAKTIQELIRVLSTIKDEAVAEKETMVEMYVSDNQILFTVGSVELISRLIEGQYPDYQQIIPSNSATQVSINRAEFIRAVKAASIFSKTGINDINLDFPVSKKRVTITSESSQVGENTAEIEADTAGKDNGIVVNYRYLLDGLNNIESENIYLEIIDSATPCIMHPEKNKDYLYIIMPIKQ